jgi:hypothetical protein
MLANVKTVPTEPTTTPASAAATSAVRFLAIGTAWLASSDNFRFLVFVISMLYEEETKGTKAHQDRAL